jgi:HEAT repeat protein
MAIPVQYASARRGGPDPERAPTTLPVATGIQWLTSLDQGYKDAAKYQRPMLVIYGAEWCAPCRALKTELDKADVRDKLAGWTLVHLDVDKPEPGVEAYQGPIPAIRLLSPQGKRIASREGYLAGAELLKWMQENVPAAIPVDPDLVGDAAPSAEAMGRLVAKLGSADASARESAASRLAPFAAASAPPVVDAFAKGNLRVRLAAMELLSGWKAPVGGMDPWQPETIDAARIDALRKWAAAIKPVTTQPAALDGDQKQAAELDLSRLLTAADPGEAGIIATRLARIGPALLPLVLEKIKQISTDRQRERLTALRYKLVATSGLMQQWPGGLDRLASTDAQTRHVAADELAARATADEMPLLLELFSDPDPLVREISLASLQKIGGKEGTAALVKLLHDPVPNVRAAVLKQLAEAPTPEIADAVIAYIPGEKDNDLVVHAVRVLKASATANATKCLVGLLSHASWRVRAEAIDALADMAQQNNATPSEEAADAVLKRLDDPDSFVVGRALAAIKPMGRNMSEKSLSDLATRRPELASDILKSIMAEMGRGGNTQNVGVIRGMCASKSPALRAAAVVALADLAQVDCSKEVTAALGDKVDSVKIAGGKALFEALSGMLPKDGYIDKPSFFGFGGGRVQVDAAKWVADFRAGKGQPQWVGKLLPALQEMVKSPDKAMQRAGALPLVCLGHEDEVMPILLEAAKADPDTKAAVAGALPWLPWEKCVALFKALTATQPDDRLVQELTAGLTILRDPRAADLLWSQLAGDRTERTVDAVYRGLQLLYFGQEFNGGNNQDEAKTKVVADAAREHLKAGSDSQKIIALALLLSSAKDQVKEPAKKIYEDEKSSPMLRSAAFQIFLLSAETADGQKMAVDALASGKLTVPLQRIALTFLALGGRNLNSLENGLWLSSSFSTEYDAYGQGQIRQVKPPVGLKPDVLMPFVSNSDHTMAAYAGYLLCLAGKKEGLPPILQYWKEHKETSSYDGSAELVYTAISALDDDSQTPVLEEIYTATAKNNYNLREFYWTIRAMHGPKILTLRKKMRDEVGMEQLQ